MAFWPGSQLLARTNSRPIQQDCIWAIPKAAFHLGRLENAVVDAKLAIHEISNLFDCARFSDQIQRALDSLGQRWVMLGIGTTAHFASGKNRKGRDIGYALATSSCEGVNSVDACTVTAL